VCPKEKESSPAVGDVPIPHDMRPALRSDHAGETGAVFIYRGILAFSRDKDTRAFAEDHLKTELDHLRLMQQLVPSHGRSRLLWLWRTSGFLTGALPALIGPTAVFRTVAAVETFVDQHYREQVDRLANLPDFGELRELLEACRLDELSHRDDAASRLGPPGPLGKMWQNVVKVGSSFGVAAAYRF